MQQVTDIFFDLDHTLWDFERNSALAFAKVLPACGVDIPLDKFLQHYVPLNLTYWEKYRNDEISQDELRYRRLKDTFDAVGYDVADSVILQISDLYIEQLPENNHLFDGAVETLEYLSAKYSLHIITNGFDRVQNRKLENAGIMHYFKTITNSELAGVKKPNPKIYQYALDLAQTNCGQSIMIGDCIDADVRGARNCGLEAIWFSTEISDGVKSIANLSELKLIL